MFWYTLMDNREEHTAFKESPFGTLHGHFLGHIFFPSILLKPNINIRSSNLRNDPRNRKYYFAEFLLPKSGTFTSS
jgi:hypothetical protein